ncbi:peptidylprolyl isomerase [Oceanomicrobium pacificus]|uniref:Parvulin-like PPIase n=1 Tax=Oceanomicrobium pacificus TaxID=2692916 RepID=A0A6B0TWZ9_9RHOB|nr:peptidylprolyl isomerase [Oceanomicrobium pacificus]MXU65812.1 hypothetical protein [Oceanomicrobium pacificus]
MLTSFRSKKSNIFVWILMGLLIVGLIGFGGQVGSGFGPQAVATVGEEDVTADDYVRAMRQELNRFSQQTGQSLTMSQARAFGVDRMVLGRLVNTAALDGESTARQISASDATVATELRRTPAFQGLDGSFDKDAYEFALDRQNLSPAEYEELVRDGIARDLLNTAVSAGIRVPMALPGAIAAYVGEERSFEMVRLSADTLGVEAPSPGYGALQAYHQENAERYTTPAQRQITVAYVTPELMIDQVEIAEEDLRAAYEDAGERYNTPELRAVDRIVFGTAEQAQEARDRIDAGDADFDAIAAERGLSDSDIDLGDQRREDLAPAAAQAVFAATDLGVVGPVDSKLGPALFRVNAILDAQSTPFEEAREELRREAAREIALDRIAALAEPVQDLIIGGATLEELAEETDLTLETISFDETMDQGLAGYEAFRAEALAAGIGEDRDVQDLGDGGMFVLRVEGETDPVLQPLNTILTQVMEDKSAEDRRAKLADMAEEIRTALEGGETLADAIGDRPLSIEAQGPVARDTTLPGLPATLAADLFELEAGQSMLLTAGDDILLVHLTDIMPFDVDTEDNGQLLDTFRAQISRQVSEDMFGYFAQALQAEAGVTLNQALLDNINAQFP